MPERPSMHARDSSGRRVSLLNDDPLPQRPPLRTTPSSSSSTMAGRSSSTWSMHSTSSLETPILLRSESFDSHTTEARSPITPDHAFGINAHLFPAAMHAYKDPLPYDAHFDGFSFETRPSLTHHRHSSFESRAGDDEVHMDDGNHEKMSKRYPCRYRDSHGCDKTFTTSGHASRHSKIHTAEKAVQCTFENCTKKFTRSDNMKQHLETHNKDKDRRASMHKPSVSRSGLMIPAGVNKKPGKRSAPSSMTHSPNAYSPGPFSPTNVPRLEFPMTNPIPDPGTIYGSFQPVVAPPSSYHPAPAYNPFEMDGFCNVLLSRPTPARTDSGGLEVLAQAAASVPDEIPVIMG